MVTQSRNKPFQPRPLFIDYTPHGLDFKVLAYGAMYAWIRNEYLQNIPFCLGNVNPLTFHMRQYLFVRMRAM